MKVYMVSSGDYSDYSIEGVFSTEELAEKFQSHFMSDRIEVRDLDPAVPECEGDRYVLDYILNSEERKITRITNDGSKRDWEAFLLTGKYGDSDRTPLRCECRYFAKTQAHAYKIASDRIMALQAGSTFIAHRMAVREFVKVEGIEPSKILSTVWYDCTWRVDGKVAKLVSKVKAK